PAWHTLDGIPMDEVARGKGQRDIDQESRICRAAIQIDARQMIEHERETRGIAPKRIKERDGTNDQKETEFARKQPTNGDAVPQDEQGWNGPCEKIVRRAIRPGSFNHAVPVRSPIIISPAEGSEHVAEQDRGEARRWERSHGGDAVTKRRPRRGHEKL